MLWNLWASSGLRFRSWTYMYANEPLRGLFVFVDSTIYYHKQLTSNPSLGRYSNCKVLQKKSLPIRTYTNKNSPIGHGSFGSGGATCRRLVRAGWMIS
jgi:hypothetical protein